MTGNLRKDPVTHYRGRLEGPPHIERLQYVEKHEPNLDLVIYEPGNIHRAFAAYCDGIVLVRPEGLGGFFKDHQRIGYISDLYVGAAYRRRGWGSLLVKAWLEHAKTYKATGVYLNLGASEWLVDFYKGLGFTEIMKGDTMGIVL